MGFAEPNGLVVDSAGFAPNAFPPPNAPSELRASCGFCSAAWVPLAAHTGLASGVFCCAALAKDAGAAANAANPPPLLLPLPKAEEGGGLAGVVVAPKDVLPNADCPNAGLLAEGWPKLDCPKADCPNAEVLGLEPKPD